MSTSRGKYDLELLKSIHDYYINKKTKIENNDNILIKYLKNQNIIKFENNDSSSLSLFVNELIKQIDNNNNIILPFLEPMYILIDIYINLNDNNIQKEIWEKIFIKLIQNGFINKECLMPIYSYFTELYSDIENITQSDDKIDKFKKVVDLWKLLYINILDKKKAINSISSFCFLGTGLEILLPSQIPINVSLNIRIDFINENFFEDVNQEDCLIIIGQYNLTYKYIISKYGLKNIKYIEFQYKNEYPGHELLIYFNKEEKGEKLSLNDYNNKKLQILNNFYGQIKNIKISFFDYSKSKFINSKTVNPYPLKDNNGIIFYSKYKFTKQLLPKQVEDFNANIYPFNDHIGIDLTIKAENINLFKVNYINCKEQRFNAMNYFGGIIQFLPFLNIINGLYNNKNIILIGTEKKGKILFDFSKNILLVIFRYINDDDYHNQEQFKSFEKYWTFFLYVINKIEPFQSENFKIDIEEFTQKNKNIYAEIIVSFLQYINSRNNKELNILEILVSEKYFKDKGKRMDNLNLFCKTNNQLYKHIMKQLFVYNKLWSKQYIFFKNVKNCYQIYDKKENKEQIKFKRLSNYTTNFQQPLIYPILEIKKYYPNYPNFKSFKYEHLYKNSSEKILNYDFSLDKFKDCLDKKFIKNYLDNDNKDIINSYKCCLIKRMYHVKGRIGWIDDNNKKNNKINIMFYFLSDKDFCKETCNRKNNSDLCFGSTFHYMEKEKNRLICIPKEKIVFAIKRVYYHKLSAIEIFTSDNKSYYFNFRDEVENIKEKLNKFIFLLNDNFKEIRLKNHQVLGWYNPHFEQVFFPLFSENIDIWKEKNIYSNFDKLMIINLFSNRSFHDLNQYPIFPMLYDEIKLKRNMNQPIGFQELDKDSIERTKLIKETYDYEKEFSNDNTEENSYFSVIFSNITFVCNYLIRVYPYSYISIEIQGSGFDTPSRLFFSVKSMLNNTLSQRSDLRELIPEIFYFPQLFSNLNNIELNKLPDGSNIDNVYIKNKNEDENEKYIFLQDMRDNLEKEDNLNQWIDLIFGINKEYNENTERYYNSKCNVELKSRPDLTNDDLNLQSCDFGVLPLKLFSTEFPKQNEIKPDLENKIVEFNYAQFKKDHIHCLSDERISFICIGEKGINSNYLDLINDFKIFGFSVIRNFFKIKSSKEQNRYYLFTGDALGSLTIYKMPKKDEPVNLMEANEEFIEINPEKNYRYNIDNHNYILLNKFNDHSKEITYIDYLLILKSKIKFIS